MQAFTVAEIASQPDLWTRAAQLATEADDDAGVAGLADDAVVLDFADERSVVQTRFATCTLAFLRELVQPGAADGAAGDARLALERPLPIDPEPVEQWTF